MAPAVYLSGVVAFAVSVFMVDGWAVTTNDLMISLLLGTVQIGAQYILLTTATRFISAADVALVMILEVILAPLWVWLVFGEEAPPMVLSGGLVIVAALVMKAMAPQMGSRENESPPESRVHSTAWLEVEDESIARRQSGIGRGGDSGSGPGDRRPVGRGRCDGLRHRTDDSFPTDRK
jgi:hypothetical protein